MKRTVFGLVAGGVLLSTVLGWAASNPSGSVEGAVARLGGSDHGLIALSSPADTRFQQVTVIDTERRVMSVYHIDNQTGRIDLMSVRDFSWDLKMEQFNGSDPLPREIRAMVNPP